MHFPLRYRNGLYYCDTDVYTVVRDPVRLTCAHINAIPHVHRCTAQPQNSSQQRAPDR